MKLVQYSFWQPIQTLACSSGLVYKPGGTALNMADNWRLKTNSFSLGRHSIYKKKTLPCGHIKG